MRLIRTIAGIALAGGISAASFAVALPAGASSCPYPDGSCQASSTTVPLMKNTPGKSITKSSTLPFTGGDVAGIAAIGAGAAIAGAVVVRNSRRRREAQ